MLVSVAVGLVAAELVFRHRYAHMFRTPSPEVLAIHEHLILHPDLGFTWRPNVSVDENISFSYADVAYPPLSTDAHGFANPPEAIAAQRAGERIEIVGLGDSFMEHGAYAFREMFGDAGIAYYSMAIHRQAPPQYNNILREYALPLKPDWVVYGLFENDFVETADYEAWRTSGLDWFAYHGGTWCGPPVAPNAAARAARRHMRGLLAFAKVLRTKVSGAPATATTGAVPGVELVSRYAQEAADLCREYGVRFLIVVIPSKVTTLQGESPESERYDELLAQLEGIDIDVLDLRPAFEEDPNPAALYYEIDSHWNEHGIRKAGEAILRYIMEEQPEEAAAGDRNES